MVITADQSVLDPSGLRAQIRPEGDTREVAMNNRGLPRTPELAIRSLSAVRFQRWRAATQSWVNYWYAQVRQGGNTRNVTGENMVLRSLSLRLGEVPLSPAFTAPEQPAHLTVQAMIQDALPSLDGLVLFDAALCPDLGFDAKEIKNANQLYPLGILEGLREQGLASEFPIDLRYGVNADRYFYCRLALTDILELTEGEGGDVEAIEWKEPVAEKPCTAVKWFVARKPDNTWLTYDSFSPLYDDIGLYMKSVEVRADIDPWTLVPGHYEWHQEGQPIQSSPATSHEALRDRQTTESYGAGGATSEIFLQFVPDPGETWTRAAVAGSAMHGGGASFTLTGDKPPETTIAPGVIYAAGNVALGWVNTTVYPQEDRGPRVPFIATGEPDPVNRLAAVHVAELRVERINTPLLDGLARFYFQGPAAEPADITLRTVLDPGDFKGRVGLSDYGRAVEAYELRMSAEGGLELGVMTGQADDPGVLAQASLVRALDQGAKIGALTAQR